MITRRELIKMGVLAGAGVALPLKWNVPSAFAQAAQTLMAGSAIPQFMSRLPILDVTPGGTIKTLVADATEIQLHMREFVANILPAGFVLPNGLPYSGTYVWGYIAGSNIPALPLDTYTGPVIVATRGTPTQMRFVNDLGSTGGSNVLAWVNSTDQTLHWADPLNGEANACAMAGGVPAPGSACAMHYAGSIPACVHLHGGEVPPVLDGGPDAWFTSDGLHLGHGYYSMVGALANEAIYRYPNTQEAAMIWFHDHVLGATRLNVYAGLAGAYPIIDPNLQLPTGLHPVGLQQGATGSVDFLVPLVIQDRMFDTNGQLFFPAGPPFTPNPDHPFWVPEFVGDSILVNGKAWPFLEVAPKRYRFLFVNGSNARTYEMFFVNPVTKLMGPPIWQIGTDGGYLDAPAKINPNAPKGQLQRLVLMPGERADVIVDFAGLQGQTLILRNTGRTPYPKGAPPSGSTLGRILQIRVNQPFAGPDLSYNPASGTPLRTPMIRLVNPAAGTLAVGVTADKTRQLTLNEVLAPPSVVNGIAYPGGPLEILVNNTKYDGLQADGTPRTDFQAVTINGVTTYYSEVPNEGDTEVWEIVNLTADAHPIHTHLTQFQLVNRQNFNLSSYNAAYAAAFPAGVYTPGFGPPKDYRAANNPLSGGKEGGNPDIVPYLQGPVMLPAPNEAGWKDTVQMLPGHVTRIAVRFAPTDKAMNDPNLDYPFDPNANGHGFVWHCHIIDHEDNEMMRPSAVNPRASATRTYVQGTDY